MEPIHWMGSWCFILQNFLPEAESVCFSYASQLSLEAMLFSCKIYTKDRKSGVKFLIYSIPITFLFYSLILSCSTPQFVVHFLQSAPISQTLGKHSLVCCEAKTQGQIWFIHQSGLAAR